MTMTTIRSRKTCHTWPWASEKSLSLTHLILGMDSVVYLALLATIWQWLLPHDSATPLTELIYSNADRNTLKVDGIIHSMRDAMPWFGPL